MSDETQKKRLSAEEEASFFWHLGFRFYATILRGHLMGHKRPFSAARDYLHVEALEGADREASEFLVDVAHMVSQGREEALSLEELHQKWGLVATWHPGDSLGGEGKSAALNVWATEEHRRKKQKSGDGL
jgi:hypothetical protein